MLSKIAGVFPSCCCAKPAGLAKLAAGDGFPPPQRLSSAEGQDLLSQWALVCSSRCTDAPRLHFYELTLARELLPPVLMQSGVPGEIFTPGRPNHM